jgi:hypothetical protein
MPNPSKLDALLRGIAGQAPESKYIRAYHGSPYDWDRVDMSKIGTGEGAAAYGHGLYASQAEPVADWYRRELSGPPDLIIGGELVRWIAPTKTPRERALRLLQKSATRYYDDPMQAVREAMLDASDQYGGRESQPIIKSLMRFKSDGVTFGPRKGKTYELEIAHPETSLLDYDAALPDQPEYVRSILPSLNLPLEDATARTLKSAYGFEKPQNITGREIQGALIRDLMAHRGVEWPQREAAASKTFANAGIPGLRYLDEYSRGAREGTRNYVMFPGTEDSIRILRKFGVMAPIPMAAGAAGAAAGGGAE